MDATAPRRQAAWLVLLLAAYLVSRLYGLSTLPVFVDEAIHIGWARETLQGHLFAGSYDGKWLPTKVMAAFVALPLHPLLAARLAAVLAGAGALAACVFVGGRLYSPRVGWIAGLLYLVAPFALLHNRMALADPFAAAFGGATLYFSLAAATSNRWRDVACLAISLIGATLSKFSAICFALLPLVAVMLFQPRPNWGRHLARISGALAALAVPVGLMLWRQHGVHVVLEFGEIGGPQSQGSLVGENLRLLTGWLWMLLTPTLATALALSLLWLLRRRREPADLLVAAAWFLSVVPFVLTLRIWFPRYLAPSLVPACLLMARFADDAFSALDARIIGRDPRLRRAALALTGVVLLASPIWLDAQIVLDPARAALPRPERGMLVEGSSSGWGVPELAEYLRGRSLASDKGINVLRFFFANQANTGLDVYLSPTAKLSLHTIDPTDPGAPAAIARLASEKESLFILNPPNEADELAQWRRSVQDYIPDARRVWQYSRIGGRSAVEAWELRPSTDDAPEPATSWPSQR